MPEFDPSWLTFPGAIAMIFVALWRGWLIPGSTLDRLTKQWEETLQRIEETQNRITAQQDDRLQEAHQREADWKSAHDIQQEISSMVAAQMGELLKQFGVLENFIRATPDAIVRLHSLSQEEKKL